MCTQCSHTGCARAKRYLSLYIVKCRGCLCYQGLDRLVVTADADRTPVFPPVTNTHPKTEMRQQWPHSEQRSVPEQNESVWKKNCHLGHVFKLNKTSGIRLESWLQEHKFMMRKNLCGVPCLLSHQLIHRNVKSIKKKNLPRFVWDINLQTCLLRWIIQSASKFANPSIFFSGFNKTVDCGSGKASRGNTQYGTSSEICYSVVNWGSFTHENISQTGWKIPKPDAFSEKDWLFLN